MKIPQPVYPPPPHTHTQLIEVSQPLSPSMSCIADALLELIHMCIKDLQRSNKLDTTDLTLEQGIFKAFDEIVRRQLDPVWHTVSAKTKQVLYVYGGCVRI